MFYLTAVNIPDELYGEIEKAVKSGACCSVNHWVKKTLKAALKWITVYSISKIQKIELQ